jgi:hypothetical protein
MSGIAICFPMSDLPFKKISKRMTVPQYLGHIAKANMIYGRTAETCEGIARTVAKRKGRNMWNDEGMARTSASLKGRPSHRKGHTKENDPSVRLMAEKKKGINKSNNPNFARRSVEMTGKTKYTSEHFAKMAKTKSGRSKETHAYIKSQAEKITGRYTGANSFSWIDGRSFVPYTKEFNENMKKRIKERDGYACQCCGMNEEKHRIVSKSRSGLDIHHIDYTKKHTYDDNLVAVCHICNIKSNSNREFWQRFYTDKLLIRSNGILVYG